MPALRASTVNRPVQRSLPSRRHRAPRSSRSRPAARCRTTATSDVVPLGEDVGRDHDLLADRPLDREPPAVDLGRDPLDDHPGRCLLVRRAWLRVRLFRLDLSFRRHDSPSAAAPLGRAAAISSNLAGRLARAHAVRALIPHRPSQILARGRIVSRAIVTRIDHGDGQAGMRGARGPDCPRGTLTPGGQGVSAAWAHGTASSSFAAANPIRGGAIAAAGRGPGARGSGRGRAGPGSPPGMRSTRPLGRSLALPGRGPGPVEVPGHSSRGSSSGASPVLRVRNPSLAGSPWEITLPGLPQSRTCGLPASGSSHNGFTARRFLGARSEAAGAGNASAVG